MVPLVLRRIKLPLWLGVALALACLLGSLQLMTSAMRHSSELSGWYSLLVTANAVATLLLLGLVVANGYWLARQWRQQEAGSRLTVRMASLFILLTLAPATVVFYHSMQFLHRSIDSWFDAQIDRAMADALQLGRTVLDERTRALVDASGQIAESLSGTPENQSMQLLDQLRENAGAAELTMFGKNGRVFASSSVQPANIVPDLPEESLLLNLNEHQPYVGLEPATDDQPMRVRVISRLLGPDALYLQTLYAIPPRIGDLAESLQAAFGHYKEMNYLRKTLKLSFSLALSLVLLMSLLAAIWAAFLSIRRIVAPVRELALATRKVADGDYEQRVPVQSQDELGFLVQSFNEMTRRIAVAYDEAHRSRAEVEQQRAYLETILANLSSGVVSFDALMRIRTANQAANAILSADLGAHAGQSLTALAVSHPALTGWVETVQNRLADAKSTWQEEIALAGRKGRQELFCRGTPLFSAWGYRSGAVVVFDDVTELIQAQRSALWSEMARRLAHEIKNPLTPIQLSAERLRHKLAGHLEAADAEVVNRATRTIVQQVEAMKTMVNAFNDYARPSKIQPVPLDVADLAEEVMALYPPASGLRFELRAEDELPLAKGDPVHIRQVLHNLFKNALEARGEGTVTMVTVRLRRAADNPKELEVTVHDNGPGIAPEFIERVFEPYVTSKTRGTGLGLAVVRKIVEEHGGSIRVDTRCKEGAGFIIRLPLADVEPTAERRSSP